LISKIEGTNHCSFISFPNETLSDIFSFCISNKTNEAQSLTDEEQLFKESIKNLMKISMTCTTFNNILTYKKIGSLCKNYSQVDKDLTLLNFIKKIKNDLTCKCYLPALIGPALIFVYAGADINVEPESVHLLYSAISQNNIYLVKKLFEHNANPNIKSCIPPFFMSRTIEMTQLCIDNGADIHKNDSLGQNVLWYAAGNLNLLKFYLKQGVNPEQLDKYNNSCLLHRYHISLESMEILLNKTPRMVNVKNINGKTPLDVNIAWLKESLHVVMIVLNDTCKGTLSLLPHDIRKHIAHHMIDSYLLIKNRIQLLKDNGACTAQGLKCINNSLI
jgi:hypothetical protein